MMTTLVWNKIPGTRMKVPYFFSLSQKRVHRIGNTVFNVAVYLLALSLVIGLPLFIVFPVSSGAIVGTYTSVFFFWFISGMLKLTNEDGLAKKIRNGVQSAVKRKLIDPDDRVNLSAVIDKNFRFSSRTDFLIDSADYYQVMFISREWEKIVKEESRILVDRQSGDVSFLLDDLANGTQYQRIFEHFRDERKDRSSLRRASGQYY